MKNEYNNAMVVMTTAIHQWKTQYTSQKPGIMSWPPKHMICNPQSAITSPNRSLQPKTENKPKMNLQ